MTPALRALVLLSADHARRLLREPMVLRSLVFPVALGLGTVLATVAAVVWLRPSPTLALTPDVATPELVAAVEADGYPVRVVDDPGELVEAGTATLGTDGRTLWLGNGGHPPLAMEAHVRTHLGTVWRPHEPRATRARRVQDSNAIRPLAITIGALFALFGVVFGAGAVARDRDEGTLDAELSLPVPHVVQGLARWLAASTVLGGFYALSVLLLHAVTRIDGAVDLALHGAAGASASAALGLLVVGRAGLDRGFAGPLSAGLVGVFGTLGLGVVIKPIAGFLPIASMVVDGAPPGPPVLGACALGALAAVAFARRTAVT